MNDTTNPGGAAAATGGSGGNAASSGNNSSASAAPWYGDKIDEVTRGFWQNKGIDPSDPVAVATKLTEHYRNAEKFIGAPPEEMLRIPKPNASETDIRAYWGRIGVPAEAKDYDLSAVKFSNGEQLETKFTDMFRSAAHSARIPKDRASDMLSALVKHMEDNDAADLAERTSTINAEKEALAKNWGQNANYNQAIAKRALDDLGKAAGLTPEQTTAAWDALSKTGGIGASHAMEMLRTIGARMGEASPFVTGTTQPDGAVMSRAQAKARIDELKSDRAFGKRLLETDRAAANREWTNLHKIAFGEDRRM